MIGEDRVVLDECFPMGRCDAVPEDDDRLPALDLSGLDDLLFGEG